MKTFKSTIVVLSVFCYIAVFIYILFSAPMLAGYIPTPVLDTHLADSCPDAATQFPKGSMFYYHKTDVGAMGNAALGYVAVYMKEGKKCTGIIAANDETFVTTLGTNEVIYVENILGINYTKSFPAIGAFYGYIQNHVAVIVIIGVILALRIMFIYVDPYKRKAIQKEDDFEHSFKSVLTGDTENDKSIHEIFASEPEQEEIHTDAADSTREIKMPPKAPDPIVEAPEPIAVVAAETPKKAEAPKPAFVRVDSTQSVADYINGLTFDSNGDSWYSASQVDDALDTITAKVYALVDEISAEKVKEPVHDNGLDIVKEQKAELEKRCLVLEAKLSDTQNEIEAQQKTIESYKEMEKKVAKLVAALKAEKSGKANG